MLPSQAIEETSFSLSKLAPAPPERRLQQRHLTILRVGTLIVNGERELCLVRNISAGGVMAHVYRPIDEGTKVGVEIKNGETLPGKVIWSKDANIGIEFDAPIDVTELLASPRVLDNGWRSRMPRIEIERMVKVRCGATVTWARTSDISQGGVKITTDHVFPAEADVVVTLDGLRPMPGVVRWQQGGTCGIRFIQVVPFAELMEWLKRDG